MPKSKPLAASKGIEDRQSSESGDDHDHDQYDDHDMDQDNDNDHDQDTANDVNAANNGAAPIKRKRLTQACDPCRKKKIKCNGVKPSCAHCTKLNATCTYLPSTKKRGPRQGYIELLERRLDKMEQLLQHGPAAIDPELLDSKSILSSRLRPGNHRSSSPTEDSASTAKESRARVEPEDRYFGATAGFTTQQANYDKQNDPSKTVAEAKSGSQSTLSRRDWGKNPIYGIKDELPRKEILDHLVELFFDSIYFQLPIIHPGTFMKQYKEGKVSPNLLNSMCAAVARFSQHPDVVTTPKFLAGEPFAASVRGNLLSSIDIPTVSNVQSLLLLSMYEYGAARGPRAWMFGGMAVRQAQELGLNREDSSPVFHLNGDWVMRETRRRTFWACFMFDVLASSSSGRPRMMDERDCEVLLPSEDHDWCDERPVVTEMLDDGEDSSSGTEQEPSATSGAAGDGSTLHNMDNAEAAQRLNASEGEKKTPSATATTNHIEPDSANGVQDAGMQSPKSKKQAAGHVLSSFAYLIRIVAVLGKVSQYVNRPRSKKAIPPNQRGSEFSIIDAALTAWHKSVPPHLAYSIENGKMVMDKGEGCLIVFMHVIYNTAVVLLHRPILAADKAVFSMDSSFVENSLNQCSDAASKVSDVLEFVQAHITNAFASDPTVAARARRSLSIHVKVLQTMKSYWSMADKFFYIIRDLYSIQSKISSSASATSDAKSQRNQARPTNASAGGVKGSSEVSGISQESPPVTDGLKEGAVSTGAIASGKLASISSFLKSDSGLVALWRRATEMQVLDEAKQESRRLSMSEDAAKQPLGIGEKKLDPQDLALQDHRDRMNALEIQQINQEFDRRWKSKLEAPASSTAADRAEASGRDSDEAEDHRQDAPSSKRGRKNGEPANLKVAKQAKLAHTAKSSQLEVRKVQSLLNVDNTDTTHASGGSALSTGVSSAEPSGEQPSKLPHQTTYRHSVVQQPPQLQQGSYILHPMQIQPPSGPPASSGSAGSILGAGDISHHLGNVYGQQNQQRDSLGPSIDLIQS
ncbi:hypothetical protein BGZ99_008564 [Dissophora globulifera]|uniref:Zn(2)-C6 fungal-type domain-containing protein n=1 Tax=Dissophora globulifera TaxID=979702 RepID=A0A9P6UYZ3_9FUNG|nr:hypothetical protein BGZ99_008564 [Dissophora globulifera]